MSSFGKSTRPPICATRRVYLFSSAKEKTAYRPVVDTAYVLYAALKAPETNIKHVLNADASHAFIVEQNDLCL